MAIIYTAALQGIEALPVTISATVEPGLPAFDTAGLAELSVRESRVRVRSAIRHSALPFPGARVTVTLDAPEVRKDGTSFDLPMALSVLVADGTCPAPDGWLVVGELSLTGAIRPVCGAIAVAVLAKQLGMGVLCPRGNTQECLAVGVPVRTADTLGEAVAALQGKQQWAEPLPQPPADLWPNHTPRKLCWSDVRGHSQAKRALEIAAAGGHSAILVGTPGTGKTMLARRLPTILPPLSPEEAVEATTICSVAGLLPNNTGLLAARPFRAPHHTASAASLVGGGSVPKPGEVSLAHRGVLFLDELPEFPRHVVETLRQPLEDGFVTVTRARQTVRFPARTMLIAALNPCPCGHHGGRDGRCQCSPLVLERYRSRLSEQMLGHFDIQLRLPQLAPDLLREGPVGETSEQVRARVVAARARQTARWSEGCTNTTVSMSVLRKTSPIAPAAHDLLLRALDAYNMSPRAHDNVWRVAATIADLDAANDIGADHIGEALQYRFFDRSEKGQ